MELSQTTAERIDELIRDSGETLGTLAKKIGVSASTLSELRNKDMGLVAGASANDLSKMSNYQKRDRDIRCSNLIKICEYFNVSADYLLCLSDVKTRNETIDGINRRTGLSAKAIVNLHLDTITGGDFAKFVSFLLENEKFMEFFRLVSDRNGNREPHSFIVDTYPYPEIDGKELIRYVADKIIWEILDAYEPGK